MEWTYDASGAKWLKKINNGGVISEKRYLDNLEYSGSNLEAIYFAGGRAVPEGAGYAYQYIIRDHLGNSRVMFKGTIGGPKIVQENHYYPFGMNLDGIFIGSNHKYQYNGKELNDDLGYNQYDYGARWYDASVGRFTGVDPLADLPHNVPLSPYHYVSNNPINNIDPDGRDWYQNNDGEQVWFNNRDASYTDDDGIEWSNIGEERLYFGGKNLIYYTQSEDDDGNLTLNMEVFDAVSGRENNGFDYSEENQAAKGSGPIPEGDYSINPSLVQSYSDLSFAQKAASMIGRGQWPGGRYAWGENRVWINPSSVEVTNPSTGETVTRTDMSIHGGSVPGSAGCVDCHKDAPRFFNSLSKSKQSRIPLRVKYQKRNNR